MLTMKSSRHAQSRGFSLIELMVALVVGLIVIGAVLALVTSIMKSNRQSLDTTRLMQEMRATAAVISSDMRRARSVADPLAVATETGGNPYKAVDTATAGCVKYAYAGAIGGPYRAIFRDSANNKVVVASGATSTACNSTGTPLTSDQVEITALTFESLPLAAGVPPPSDKVRQIRMTLTGRLKSADPEMTAINRTITQSIFVRSVGTGS